MMIIGIIAIVIVIMMPIIMPSTGMPVIIVVHDDDDYDEDDGENARVRAYGAFSGNRPGIQREARAAGKARRSGARVLSAVRTSRSVRAETMRRA
jgi:hypothetical protein